MKKEAIPLQYLVFPFTISLGQNDCFFNIFQQKMEKKTRKNMNEDKKITFYKIGIVNLLVK